MFALLFGLHILEARWGPKTPPTRLELTRTSPRTAQECKRRQAALTKERRVSSANMFEKHKEQFERDMQSTGLRIKEERSYRWIQVPKIPGYSSQAALLCCDVCEWLTLPTFFGAYKYQEAVLKELLAMPRFAGALRLECGDKEVTISNLESVCKLDTDVDILAMDWDTAPVKHTWLNSEVRTHFF